MDGFNYNIEDTKTLKRIADALEKISGLLGAGTSAPHGGYSAAGEGQRAVTTDGCKSGSERQGRRAEKEKKLNPKEWGEKYCPDLWDEIVDQLETYANFHISDISHMTWNLMIAIKYSFMGRVDEIRL